MPLLALGGTYNASNLAAGCGTLPPRDQRLLRQLVRRFTPWLKSQGLVTVEQFAQLWQFSHSATVAQLSSLSRSRLEHALGGIDRRPKYSTIRRNALFMLTLGLGIHPVDSCTLTLSQLERIRQLHQRLGCYTQWAWQYIDKLLATRHFQLKGGRNRTADKYLFINMDGTVMTPSFALALSTQWPTHYGLDLQATIRAHQTLAIEFTGAQPQIDALYKEIFNHEVLTTPTPLTSTPTAAQSSSPLANYRQWIGNNWVAARRYHAICQYLSRHSAEPLDSDPGEA